MAWRLRPGCWFRRGSGGVIFIAIFLHKIPEGFTVASLMLASGQSRTRSVRSSAILGAATLAGWR